MWIETEEHLPFTAAGQNKKAVCCVNVFKDNKVDMTKRHFQQIHTEFGKSFLSAIKKESMKLVT